MQQCSKTGYRITHIVAVPPVFPPCTLQLLRTKDNNIPAP